MVKKIAVAVSLVALIATSLVSAQVFSTSSTNATSSNSTSSAVTVTVQENSTQPVAVVSGEPEVIEPPFWANVKLIDINREGRALLRGKVVSVNGNIVVVSSWGGNWNINVASTSDVMYHFGGRGNVDQFKPGDTVGVIGQVDQSNPFTIDARIIRDWSIHWFGARPLPENVQGNNVYHPDEGVSGGKNIINKNRNIEKIINLLRSILLHRK